MIKFENNFVVTTKTKLFVYRDEKCNYLIGCAGVKNPKDFDFNVLYKIALHKSGSKIEVA